MNTRRVLIAGVWAILTVGAGIWVVIGNQGVALRAVVLAAVLLSLGYGTARLIALARTDRRQPLGGGGAAYAVSVIVTGLLMVGPLLGSLVDMLDALVAWGIALVAFALMQISIALFSDGSGHTYLQSLIFTRRSEPPVAVNHPR